MPHSTIYTVSNGNLTAMAPAAPESEDVMQALIARHPAIIADDDGALLLVRREQPIADSSEGGGRWSLDHLFVTSSGIPVLVELKRASDTRLRREVVGQMLDYAANATAHWRAGTIAASFAATATAADQDPEALLAEFLVDGADPLVFWDQVDANFSAGRIKMVFVADTIPSELARIVEFLNEQMKADVRAVELNWFEGAGVKAFAPRTIGATERAAAAKTGSAALPPITLEAWITQHLAPLGSPMANAGEAFCGMVVDSGGRPEVTKAQASIVAIFDASPKKVYPLSISPWGKGMVALNLAYLKSHPAFADEAARRELYERVVAVVGGLSTAKLTGFPGFPAPRLLEPEVRGGLTAILRGISEAIR